MTVSEWIRIGHLRRNPHGSFDAFYAEFGPRVFRYCLRLSGDRSDAEDLAQEVFVAAFRGIARFEGRSSLTTWLYRIALLRWRTLAKRRPDGDALLEIAEQSASRDHNGGVESIDLDRAIATLSSAHRDAFLLVKAEGLTCREASAVLEIPEGTVRYHVHEAIRGLRQHLQRDEPLIPPAFDADSQTKRLETTCHELP